MKYAVRIVFPLLLSAVFLAIPIVGVLNQGDFFRDGLNDNGLSQVAAVHAYVILALVPVFLYQAHLQSVRKNTKSPNDKRVKYQPLVWRICAVISGALSTLSIFVSIVAMEESRKSDFNSENYLYMLFSSERREKAVFDLYEFFIDSLSLGFFRRSGWDPTGAIRGEAGLLDEPAHIDWWYASANLLIVSIFLAAIFYGALRIVEKVDQYLLGSS